jgi:hypothetical protein
MSFTYGHGIHYFFDYDENNNIRKQSSILGVYKYDYDTYNTLTTIRHYLYDVDKEEYKLNNTLRYDKVSD